MDFEVTIGVYAWDLADEGVETVFDNIERAGCNAIYIMTFSHGPEKRPYLQDIFPHNPRRKTYMIENATAYFTIHDECYKDTKLRPVFSERDFLQGTDWIDILVKEAKKRGIKPQAEVGHNIITDKQAEEHPDCCQIDVEGNLICPPSSRSRACINNPDVSNYFYGLLEDILVHHELDMIQPSTIFYGYSRGGTLPFFLEASKSGCFCKHCERTAGEMGYDWKEMKWAVKEVRQMLEEGESNHRGINLHQISQGLITPERIMLLMPEYYNWLRFRMDAVAGFFKKQHELITKVTPQTKLRQNYSDPIIHNVDFHLVKDTVESIRFMNYAEQEGREEAFVQKKNYLTVLQSVIGSEKLLISGIGVRPRATPAAIRRGIKDAIDAGVDGISLAFYDGVTVERLDSVRSALKEFGV